MHRLHLQTTPPSLLLRIRLQKNQARRVRARHVKRAIVVVKAHGIHVHGLCYPAGGGETTFGTTRGGGATMRWGGVLTCVAMLSSPRRFGEPLLGRGQEARVVSRLSVYVVRSNGRHEQDRIMSYSLLCPGPGLVPRTFSVSVPTPYPIFLLVCPSFCSGILFLSYSVFFIFLVFVLFHLPLFGPSSLCGLMTARPRLLLALSSSHDESDGGFAVCRLY